MDIALTNSILHIASSSAQANTAQAVELAVLKKALDVQTTAATALLDALSQPAPLNFGPLGTQLDTFA